MTALLTTTLLEVARRRRDQLPGLVETLQDDVLVMAGGTSRAAHGWFHPGAWRHLDRPVHELFLNADRRLRHHPEMSLAEDVLVTLLHEAVHVYAQAQDIRDTSRGGYYHNRRFGELALAVGLQVEPDARIGQITPRLSAEGRWQYADLLMSLEQGPVLVREPIASVHVVSDDDLQTRGDYDTGSDLPSLTSDAAPKYVFASCRCRGARRRRVTIRVSVGSWRPGVNSMRPVPGRLYH